MTFLWSKMSGYFNIYHSRHVDLALSLYQVSAVEKWSAWYSGVCINYVIVSPSSEQWAVSLSCGHQLHIVQLSSIVLDTPFQPGPLSLVQECRGLALIGPE